MNQTQILTQTQILQKQVLFCQLRLACVWLYIAYMYSVADAFSLGAILFCVDIVEYVWKSM